MENLIGKWGGTNLYNLSPADVLEYIHPDDQERLKDYPYIRSLHQCIADDGGYFITISFGDDFQFRVKRSLFSPVNIVPKFKPFEQVKFMNTKGVLEFGEIRDVSCHNNDRKMKVVYELTIMTKAAEQAFRQVFINFFGVFKSEFQ